MPNSFPDFCKPGRIKDRVYCKLLYPYEILHVAILLNGQNNTLIIQLLQPIDNQRTQNNTKRHPWTSNCNESWLIFSQLIDNRCYSGKPRSRSIRQKHQSAIHIYTVFVFPNKERNFHLKNPPISLI